MTHLLGYLRSLISKSAGRVSIVSIVCMFCPESWAGVGWALSTLSLVVSRLAVEFRSQVFIIHLQAVSVAHEHFEATSAPAEEGTMQVQCVVIPNQDSTTLQMYCEQLRSCYVGCLGRIGCATQPGLDCGLSPWLSECQAGWGRGQVRTCTAQWC